MSSIKKVLCVKAKNEGTKLFTTGAIYDVAQGTEDNDDAMLVYDNLGRKTFIILCSPCIHGEWQPLEEYVCMNHTLHPESNIGDILYGYAKNGVINFPHEGKIVCNMPGLFKKLSEMNTEPKPRHEVRHVIYDTKDNKIVNDAMGECYITLAEAQELCDEMNAPKVMKPKYTKEVEYFGMNILVPDDAKWLSTSKKGTVFSHKSKPVRQLCYHSVGNEVLMWGIDLNGIDWKDTLVEIK